MEQEDYILQVDQLKTYFYTDNGVLQAVNGVSFALPRSKTLGIIGESGSGKSVTAHSILRTVQTPGKLVGGTIVYDNGSGIAVDLAQEDSDGTYIRSLRGNAISMIFQEPSASLSPVYSIGAQMMEAYLIHQPKAERDKQKAKTTCLEMLELVGMPDTKNRFNDYPHLLSGGMNQRAMIALALVNRPNILIADEPTTALDVTVQAQITDLMKNLQAKFAMSILYITHDMGVIAEMADYIAVMYLGRIVESGSVFQIFDNPSHPYTQRLLKSMPRLGERASRLDAIRGNVPVPLDMPEECGFYSRCDEVDSTCKEGIPPIVEIEPGHMVRCTKHKGKERCDDSAN